MKKPFWQKNILRDMLERDYTVYLLCLLFLLLWEAVQFLVFKAKGNPSLIYRVKLFGNTNVGLAFAVFAPFIIVWRLLSQYNSADSSDVFYSLPTTRRSIFGSASMIAGAYLLVFLLAETAVMSILFACSKNLEVDAGYFPTRIVLIATVFLIFYGLAMICFSIASGGWMYALLYGGWGIVLICAYQAVWMIPVWQYLFRNDIKDMIWFSDIAGEPLAKFYYVTEHVIYLFGPDPELAAEPGKTATYLWQLIPWFLLLGFISLILGGIAFTRRKAERIEGMNKSGKMHIALQGAVIWAMTMTVLPSWETFQTSLNFVNYDYKYASGIGQIMCKTTGFRNTHLLYKLFPGDTLMMFSVAFATAAIWEMLYRKNIFQFWKAWAGMALGIVLIGLTQLYVVL